jgi:hypothetical protein
MPCMTTPSATAGSEVKPSSAVRNLRRDSISIRGDGYVSVLCSVCISFVGVALRWADPPSEESYLFCVAFGGLEVNSGLK